MYIYEMKKERAHLAKQIAKLQKDLELFPNQKLFITKNGKIVAKLTNPHQDRVEVAKSLFGILPKDADLNEAKEERLGAK